MIIEGSRECGMLERMRSPIFVRPLTDAERQALTAGLRSPDAFVLRRCQILLASARGERAPRIAEQLGCDDQTVLDALHAFNARGLTEQAVAKEDPDPKALACYGLLLRRAQQQGQDEAVWLRFVDGRPVSALTTQFLDWCCPKLEALGVPVWGLIWDNASWHVSRAVRTWIRTHNRTVKQQGHGVRLLVCCLPVKSPWLNPIEPKWVHSKRAIVEPTRLLSAQEVADRVCAYHGCPHEPHLTLPDPILEKAS